MNQFLKDRALLISVALLASILSFFYWNIVQENATQVLLLFLLLFLFDDNRKLRAEIKKFKSLQNKLDT